MPQVTCLYCAARLSDQAERCPACGAPSHFRRRGLTRQTQRRFALGFALLVVTVLAMALWLPR